MSRGWFSGPGIGVLDARYLMLDCTNDPLTAGLEVNAATLAEPVLILQTTDDNAGNPIQEWQNAAGAVLANVAVNGDLTAQNVYVPNLGEVGAGNAVWTFDSANRYLTVTQSDRVGVGIAAPRSIFDVVWGETGLGTVDVAQYFVNINPAGAGALECRAQLNDVAIRNTVALASGGWGAALSAIRNQVGYYGTANVDNVYCNYSIYATQAGSSATIVNLVGNQTGIGHNAGTGQITNFYGTNIYSWGNPTIANAYGNYIDDLGTNVTNFYGLYVAAQSAAGLKYGVYIADNADNYFAGRVGAGVAVPLAMVHADQASTSGAIPPLLLDQADLSEEMIEFTTTVGAGNPIDTAAHGAYYGKVRAMVTGVGYKVFALYEET